MSDWTSMILQWGPPITQIVLLCLQIYTYRRTRHYSLALIVVASSLGLLASVLIRILNSEVLVPRLRTGVLDAMILSYAAYMVIGVWGAAALFRSYIRSTDASKGSNEHKAQ
jgi:lysylphosphatidylglycerol synthetase-like protein (DUF2156 family)